MKNLFSFILKSDLVTEDELYQMDSQLSKEKNVFLLSIATNCSSLGKAEVLRDETTAQMF